VSRILRSSLPDGYFHVYTRGVAETAIFRDDEDRRSFLALLVRTTPRHGWELHALCLMTTHYHAVLEAARGHLSAGMQWLNGMYAQTFNKRYERHGHLFGARFGARCIESEVPRRRVRLRSAQSRACRPLRPPRRLAVERHAIRISRPLSPLGERVSAALSEHLFDPTCPDTLGQLWPLKSLSSTAPGSTT
jgi:REP element-mobilizing transposase RayT